MRRARVTLLAVALFLAAAPAAQSAPRHHRSKRAAPPPDQTSPLPNPTGCDSIDPSACMLPFPNDLYTRADPTTPTGRRVDFSLLGMPRNVAGKPIDPTDWNRADGFSPGSLIVTHVPGLDNATAFAETGAPPIKDISRSLKKDSPIVLIDAATGKRQLFWSELDLSIGTGPDTDAQRSLLIRPGKNLLEGHRYIVALRDLRDASGKVIPPQPTFKAYRDDTELSDPFDEQRRAHFESVFKTLKSAGVARDDLYLAWDFTVASSTSLAGRMLAIRDDAFHQLGDDNLADMKVAGKAPTFTLSRLVDMTCPVREQRPEGMPDLPDLVITDADCGRDTDARVARDVKGTMDVPCYLTTPACVPAHSHFLLNPLTNLPVAIPGNVMKVDFECMVPKSALAAGAGKSRPVIYGHGLFGGYGEIHQDQLKAMMAEHNTTTCATAWAGMATEDVPNVATILADVSSFNTLADRAQQGMLNFLYLGRLMIHPQGLSTDAAFQTADGKPLLDTRRLFYDGNSQGGIIGGALAAVAPDHNRATLGVLGMNYSTLLTRSTDFGTGKTPPPIADPTNPDHLQDPTDGLEYAYPLYTSYPDLGQRQLLFSLMQMLWDRAEPNGYAQHMTDDPYPNTPKHEIMLMAGYGDHQVSNYTAEVQARTIGACVLKDDMLPAGRYWGLKRWYGLPTVAECTKKHKGHGTPSVLTVWDGGSRPSPLGNIPQDDSLDDDPHEWVRRTPAARAMKSAFLSIDSRVVDTCGDGDACLTYNYPFSAATAALRP